MKKKTPKNVKPTEVLVQIQEQLAVLNNKLDDFINKSLTDLAQTLAAQKAAAAPRPVQQPPAPVHKLEQHRRPMFAIVCYQCGKDSELPFKPAPSRPVYCPECFAQRKSGALPKPNHEAKPPVQIQKSTETKTPAQPTPKAKKKPSTPKKAPLKKSAVKTAKKK